MSASTTRMFSVPREGNCSICHKPLGNTALEVSPKLLSACRKGKLSRIIGRDGSHLIPTKNIQDAVCHKSCLAKERNSRPLKDRLSEVNVKTVSLRPRIKPKKMEKENEADESVEKKEEKEPREAFLSFIFGATASFLAPLVLARNSVIDPRVCLTAVPIGAAVVIGQTMGKDPFGKDDLNKCIWIGGIGSALALPLIVLSLPTSVATMAGVVVGGFTAYHETRLYYNSLVKTAECFSRTFIYGACSLITSVCASAIAGSLIKV